MEPCALAECGALLCADWHKYVFCVVCCGPVFLRLVERMLERRLPRRGGGAAREMITLFQFWSYLEAEGVIDLDTHVTELAEEGECVCVCVCVGVRVNANIYKKDRQMKSLPVYWLLLDTASQMIDRERETAIQTQ